MIRRPDRFLLWTVRKLRPVLFDGLIKYQSGFRAAACRVSGLDAAFWKVPRTCFLVPKMAWSRRGEARGLKDEDARPAEASDPPRPMRITPHKLPDRQAAPGERSHLEALTAIHCDWTEVGLYEANAPEPFPFGTLLRRRELVFFPSVFGSTCMEGFGTRSNWVSRASRESPRWVSSGSRTRPNARGADRFRLPNSPNYRPRSGNKGRLHLDHQ